MTTVSQGPYEVSEPRSYLYVPGDHEDKLQHVLTRGADAVIIDLEDGVRPTDRDKARAVVQRWLTGSAGRDRAGTEIWVRVNGGDEGLEDIQAVLTTGVTGICVAKVTSAEELIGLAQYLNEAEEREGLASGSVVVQPLIETARGLMATSAIASAPRVERMQLGEVDLAADLNLEPSSDARELLFARGLVVAASAAAALKPPIGPVDPNFRALDKFRESTEQIRRLGFGSRACVHPAQVAAVNDVFTPSSAEVSRALDVLRAYEAAAQAGSGVATDSRGNMVDEAVVRRARHLLARAHQIEARG